MDPRSRLRILLLQIRNDARVRREEYESFVRYSGLAHSQISVLNVFDRPDFGLQVLKGFDSLWVGGASEATVMDPATYPFVPRGESLLLHCIDRGIPVFASCFGFQLAVIAFGGGLLRDLKGFEMGVVPISVTAEGRKDPLLCDMPSPFPAVSVHRERTLEAPDGCVTLAETESCCHAFRVSEKPFWAFQFHPEVDRTTLVERLTIYKDKYTDNDDHLNAVLSVAVETPDANALMRKFVDRVLLTR